MIRGIATNRECGILCTKQAFKRKDRKENKKGAEKIHAPL